MVNRALKLLTSVLLLLPAGFPAAQTVRMEHRVFPGLHVMDGNWAALFAASNGKVYVGLAYHGGDGHLVYYDSKAMGQSERSSKLYIYHPER